MGFREPLRRFSVLSDVTLPELDRMLLEGFSVRLDICRVPIDKVANNGINMIGDLTDIIIKPFLVEFLSLSFYI